MKRIITLTFILIISIVLMPLAQSEAKPLSATKQYKVLSFYVEDLLDQKNAAVTDAERAQLDNGLVSRLQRAEKAWAKNKKARVGKISKASKAELDKKIEAISSSLAQTKEQLSKKYQSEEKTDLSSSSSSLESIWVERVKNANAAIDNTTNPREKLLLLEDKATAKRILSILIAPTSSESSPSLEKAIEKAEKSAQQKEKALVRASRSETKKALARAKSLASAEKRQITSLEARGFSAIDAMPEA